MRTLRRRRIRGLQFAMGLDVLKLYKTNTSNIIKISFLEFLQHAKNKESLHSKVGGKEDEHIILIWPAVAPVRTFVLKLLRFE